MVLRLSQTTPSGVYPSHQENRMSKAVVVFMNKASVVNQLSEKLKRTPSILFLIF